MTSVRFLSVARARTPVRLFDRSEAFRDRIENHGHTLDYTVDGASEAGRDHVLLMLGNAGYFPATMRRLRSLAPAQRPLSVLLHAEPLPAPRASGLKPARRHAKEWIKIALRDPRITDPRSNFRRLAKLRHDGLPDLILVTTPWRQTFLAEHGIASEWVPFGHYDAMGSDMGLERDIDVLFVGARDVPRRMRIIRGMQRAGVDVLALGAFHKEKGLFGAERTEMMNRARIVLNVGRHPGELSGLRLLTAMANRACVLSEPIWDPRPFVPGVHYAEAPVEELAAAARALLADDARRTAIADAGHRFAREEATLDRSADQLIGFVEAALAARG